MDKIIGFKVEMLPRVAAAYRPSLGTRVRPPMDSSCYPRILV